MSLIEAFKSDQYKYGNLQSIPYDKSRTDVFPEGFLGRLYFSLQGSRFHKTRSGDGVLQALFCGMTDLSFDKIVSYMASIPLCVMGIWQPDGTFRPAGIHFIPTKTGVGAESMAFGGYGFLKEYWGTEEQESLTVLGIAQIFGELNIKQLHGMRYSTNAFTARYMERFGFRDLCTIPNYMMRGNKMVDGVLSTLARSDFEANLVERLLKSAK
jgi:hypothetical protein